MKTTTPSLPVVFFSVAVMSLSGCGAAGLNFNFSSQKIEKESATNPVEQIVPAWHEGEGPGLDPQHVTRGFCGQVYFITQNRGLPSEVQGRVRIYVFDDQGSESEQAKPIHQFDFEPDAWKAHMTLSKLGPAYMVFVPYTRPGRIMAACALRIRYTPLTTGPNGPVEGTPIFSQMVTLDLGGVKKPADYDTVAKPDQGQVETASKSPAFRSKPLMTKIDGAIQQASAKGDLIGSSGVQTAGFETPAGRSRDQGRLRLADFEADAGSATSQSPHKFVGDDKLDFLGNPEDVEAMPQPAPEPRRVRGPQVNEVETPAEREDRDQKLKVFTIPLGDS